MTAQTQTMTRHDLEAEIVQRSWEDNGFRKEFVAHPAELSDTDLEKVAGGLATPVVAASVASVAVTVVLAVVPPVIHDEVGKW
jgi:hypothetical protein